MKLVNILIVKANIFHKMFNFNNDISDLLFNIGVFPWDKKVYWNFGCFKENAVYEVNSTSRLFQI